MIPEFAGTFPSQTDSQIEPSRSWCHKKSCDLDLWSHNTSMTAHLHVLNKSTQIIVSWKTNGLSRHMMMIHHRKTSSAAFNRDCGNAVIHPESLVSWVPELIWWMVGPVLIVLLSLGYMANPPKIYPCMAAIHPLVAYSSRCQETRIYWHPLSVPQLSRRLQELPESCPLLQCLQPWHKFNMPELEIHSKCLWPAPVLLNNTKNHHAWNQWFEEISRMIWRVQQLFSRPSRTRVRSVFLGKEILEEKEAQMHPVSHVIVYYHVLPITAVTTYGNPLKSVIHPSWKMNAQTQEAKPLFSGLGSNMSFLNAYCWV